MSGGTLVPVRTYAAVFVALLALLFATIAAARFDLGSLNVLLALSIASLKALLVVLFFMHARWSARAVQLFAAASVLCLLVLLGLTMSDYLTRG
jgi:cytochrome c oxidase subunit IV